MESLENIISHTSSPIKTTFSPRITYRPNGMSQYRSPTISRSHAPSRTTLARQKKIRHCQLNVKSRTLQHLIKDR